MPAVFKIISGFLPDYSIRTLINRKNRLTENNLPELIDAIQLGLSGGSGLFEIFSDNIENIEPPLKNEITLLLDIGRKSNKIKSLREMENKATSIYLKLFYSMLRVYMENGSPVKESLIRLCRSLRLRNRIKSKLKNITLQSRLQIITASVLPYFIFCVMTIIYPSFTFRIWHSELAGGIALIAFAMHSGGIWLYHKITRFDFISELNTVLFIEYITFGLKNGISTTETVKDVLHLVPEPEVTAIMNATTVNELARTMNESKIQAMRILSSLITKSKLRGISISRDASDLADSLINSLESKALRFQQTAAPKALIPMFMFIFPATYALILLPVLIYIID